VVYGYDGIRYSEGNACYAMSFSAGKTKVIMYNQKADASTRTQIGLYISSHEICNSDSRTSRFQEMEQLGVSYCYVEYLETP